MANRTVELGDMHLVGLRGTFTPGTVSEIPELWKKFVPRLREIKRRKKGWVTYGACLANPDKSLEYTAATEVDEPGPVPEGLTAFTVPAGAYALFNHEGSIKDIGKTWDAIWNSWMKEEGYIHRAGAPDLERYDERWNPKTGEGPVDIYVAVERARR